jgi:hypothetical protein
LLEGLEWPASFARGEDRERARLTQARDKTKAET